MYSLGQSDLEAAMEGDLRLLSKEQQKRLPPARVHSLDLLSNHFVPFSKITSSGNDTLVFLADIVQDVSGQNPQYYVRDIEERDVLIKLVLTFEANERLVDEDIRVGGMVCIRAPRLHSFLDGQKGLIIDDKDFLMNVKVFPGCSLAAFMKLNERLVHMTSDIRCEKCQTTDARSICARCKCARYCCRECQQQHWRIHKYTCEIFKTLREFGESFGPMTQN